MYRNFGSCDVEQGNLRLYSRTNRRHSLVVCHNTVHEIEPGKLADFIGNLLDVTEVGGRLIIIDMEALPKEEPEACGVVWRQAEILELIEAGVSQVHAILQEADAVPFDVRPKLIGALHSRSVPVFEVHISRSAQPFDYPAARRKETEILSRKLCNMVADANARLVDLRNNSTEPHQDKVLAFVEGAARSVYLAASLDCTHGIDCEYRQVTDA